MSRTRGALIRRRFGAHRDVLPLRRWIRYSTGSWQAHGPFLAWSVAAPGSPGESTSLARRWSSEGREQGVAVRRRPPHP